MISIKSLKLFCNRRRKQKKKVLHLITKREVLQWFVRRNLKYLFKLLFDKQNKSFIIISEIPNSLNPNKFSDIFLSLIKYLLFSFYLIQNSWFKNEKRKFFSDFFLESIKCKIGLRWEEKKIQKKHKMYNVTKPLNSLKWTRLEMQQLWTSTGIILIMFHGMESSSLSLSLSTIFLSRQKPTTCIPTPHFCLVWGKNQPKSHQQLLL